MRLLHLSDIHFTDCGLFPETDIDRAVRERMLEDVQQMHQKRGDIDAVLVVGDIAARGKTADYNEAAVFLDRMCVQLGLAPKQVVCVPGNHDIDRDEQLPLHDAARYQLRRVDARAISSKLLSLLRDEAGKRTLLRPLKAYNEFALRYGCEVDPELLVWKPKVLDFQDRRLHIHGVNSSWVCDSSDSWENDSSKVVAGLFQFAPIAQASSAISIALCHHPLRWLRDGNLIAPWLARAHLVLTGHEHAAGIVPSGDERSVWIASGAVNPDQTRAGWIPAYNVIELELRADERLLVRVFARSWQGAYAEFGPTEPMPQPFVCELRLRRRKEAEDPPVASGATLIAEPSLPPPTIVVPEPEPLISNNRGMVYEVMRVSRDRRRRVARQLGLLPEHEERDGLAVDKALIQRALAENRLADLSRILYDRELPEETAADLVTRRRTQT